MYIYVENQEPRGLSTTQGRQEEISSSAVAGAATAGAAAAGAEPRAAAAAALNQVLYTNTSASCTMTFNGNKARLV